MEKDQEGEARREREGGREGGKRRGKKKHCLPAFTAGLINI